MKFPSLKDLFQSAGNTIKRYPFEVLFALAGTIAATTEIELRHLSRENEGWCMRIIMIANLGLLLSLSASLYTQSKQIAGVKKLLYKCAAALIAILLIFIIDPARREADYIRFFLLSLSFHLLVAFAAFTIKGHVQGFWQFNKTLFLRFLTSVLYGVVLFLGISAAIAATNFLFNFKFEWDTYSILWTWITGIFTTIFFLTGVPVDTASLDADLTYPKGLKIFTQYVLIPLSTIYVFILLAYETKIITQWQLPKGLVSNLILSYSVFGILSLLLVYPVREQNENKWLKTYARSFYFLLLPLLGLLFVAVGARVFNYGITEFRYFLIALACWLLFISVYFLFFKQQNIKLIPISLCVITLISIYGPQSAFTVSMYSQRRILVEFFKKNNAFKNGKLMPVDSTKTSRKNGSAAVKTLQYFIYHYDLKALQPYLSKDLDEVADSLGKLKSDRNSDLIVDRDGLREYKYQWAKNHLGLQRFDSYYDSTDSTTGPSFYNFKVTDNIVVVKGYDIALDENNPDTTVNDYGGIKIKRISHNEQAYILQIDNEYFKFDLIGLAKKLLSNSTKIAKYHEANTTYTTEEEYALPTDMLLLIQETPKYKVAFQVKQISFNGADKKNPLISIAYGTYLIKIK